MLACREKIYNYEKRSVPVIGICDTAVRLDGV